MAVMDSFWKEIIQKKLKESELRPQKGLGQVFLTDNLFITKLVDSSGVGQADTVLEIGPGIGNITYELAQKTKKVVAVEKDQKIALILKETLCELAVENVEIVQQDVLKITPEKLGLGPGFKVVANIPYYLTAHLIRHLLESKITPESITLMIQKEVAQRICSKPPDSNLLAVSVQFYADPKIITYVPKESFWPKPKIDSAIIKITPKKIPEINPDLFFKIVKAGFSQPRKQIANNFSGQLKIDKEKTKEWLLKNGVDPMRRAETLKIEEWIKLAKDFHN